MRPLWKGSISFGLVNIPVGLYSAIRSQQRIDFDMLRDSDLSPIHYKRVAEADGEEVPYEHIVKGYQYEKGSYVVVNREDFDRVQIKSTQVVDIKEFVELSEIEPRFFDEPYFLAPEKGADKAYALLHQALKQANKAGIAKVVIRPPREHLAAIKPLDGILSLELLHWDEELRDPAEIQAPAPALGQKELEMAATLIDSMSGKWEPEKYHDEYREALMEVIEQKIKAKGKKLPPVKRAAEKGGPKVVDLVSVLRESLAQTRRGEATRKPPHRATRHKKAA